MRKLIFWQNTPSPHQAAYIRALADRGSFASIRVVLTGDLGQDRHALGWRLPDFGDVQVIHKPDSQAVSAIAGSVDADTVQLFSEFISTPSINAILRQSLAGPGLVGIVSEGRDWRGAKGLLRRLHSLGCERPLARRVDFVLAIGHLAHEWYRRCGFSPDTLFGFAYVVEAPDSQIPPDYQGPLRLAYVGQLIRRKRVDLLLDALVRLGPSGWSLRVIGDGPEAQALAAQAERLGGPIEFLGVRGNDEVRRELANADVLVLPSHWDGWGAVVNEALMAGARVVCSDFCGAADVVQTPYGEVFASASPTAGLEAALRRQLAQGPVGGEERRAIRRYAGTLAGDSAAAYLEEIIEYAAGQARQRPLAPWRRYLRDAKAGGVMATPDIALAPTQFPPSKTRQPTT